MRAAWLFCLYFYFINLVGVKWTFLGKYIWLGELGLGGIGVVWGLDRKWGNPADGWSAGARAGGHPRQIRWSVDSFGSGRRIDA